MNKRRFLLFCFALLFLLTACKGQGDGGSVSSGDGSSSDSSRQEPVGNAGQTDSGDDAYQIEMGTRYDLPDNDVDRFVRFVSPFNILPMEFDDVSELTDETMLFTATAAAEIDFLPDLDGYSSKIEISRIEKKVGEYFGSGAVFSADYKNKDYSPYSIEGDALVRYAGGAVGQFFFPYALIEADDGYDLYLIDLMDPLFYDNRENQDRLDAGEEILYEDIREIALKMQFNVYHVVEANGRLTLKGFRYINGKPINHYVF